MKLGSRLLPFLALVVVLVAAAGCSGTDSVLKGDQGGLRLVMNSNEPAVAAATSRSGDDHSSDDDGGAHGRLQAAYVTFSSVLARNLDGELINVSVDLPVSVDLLALVEGRSFTLPLGSLPPGSYDEIVVVMSKVGLTLLDGTLIEVTPPGGGWTSIIRVDPFDVIEGETTTVNIRFNPRRSFKMIGEHFEFHPHLEVDHH